MLAFLFKVWNLARPNRARLFLGVLTGIVSGLTAPLMIGSISSSTRAASIKRGTMKSNFLSVSNRRGTSSRFLSV